MSTRKLPNTPPSAERGVVDTSLADRIAAREQGEAASSACEAASSAYGAEPSACEGEPESSADGEAWSGVERRSGRDRRVRPTRGWDALTRRGRRAGGRRAADRARAYVDVYHRGDVALVLSTFVLNLLDAFLTLHWLSLGGSEENPVMDRLLQEGDVLFLAQKCFVVGVLLIVLIVHRNFGLARIGLWALFAVYAGLIAYHSFLQLPVLLIH